MGNSNSSEKLALFRKKELEKKKIIITSRTRNKKFF